MKAPRTALIVGCVVLVCDFLRAQEITGIVGGRLVDSTGSGVVGANIAVWSPDLQGTRGTISDSAGFFRLMYLPPGVYAVKITHLSFRPRVAENVRVLLGRTNDLGKVQLSQRTLEAGEVVVTAERPLLDPASTTTGGNLLRKDFEVLPIERNYRSVASLLPHANQSYFGDEVNVAGASGGENRYFIDGNDVTDPLRGITGTNLPYNFIREIQVKSGGYEPEYRSSLGGIINAVTFSGGNEFSGQVFGFYLNNNFSSQQRLPQTEAPKGSYSQYDFGFVLGGPIIRDELWFSAAYSPSYRNEDIKMPGLDYYPDRARIHPFAGKLTWKASESLDLQATVFGDPMTEDAVGKKYWQSFPANTILAAANPDPLLADYAAGGYGAIIDGRHIISSNAFLQASFSLKTRTDKYMPGTQRGMDEIAFTDATTATVSGGYDERIDLKSTAVSGSASISWNTGEHMLKAGLEYKDIGLESYFTVYDLVKYGDSTYLLYDIRQNGTFHNRLPSAYVQDSWSVSDRFRINAGVRWDGLFIVAADGRVAQEILGPFQPRLGCTFFPDEKKNTKLFASIGRFAEDLLMNGSLTWHTGGSQLGLMWTHDPRVDATRLDLTGADTAFLFGGNILPGVNGVRGQYYDEAVLGIEQLLSSRIKLTARGIYRTLREIIEDGEQPLGSGQFYWANPGRGPLNEYPGASRDYLALELTVETSPGESFSILGSYVLSRNYGNYAGMYYQDYGVAVPSSSPQFDYLDIMKNTTGLLPNDRTHVLKLHGSYRTNFGLTCGASFIWQSGTPISELGGSTHGQDWPIFLRQRGSVGRLTSLWDLNLRFAYDIAEPAGWNIRPRLILDVFHVGSQQTVVRQDQRHYFYQDDQGNQIDPNPAYGLPQQFQPPMSVRLGMEVNF